VSISQPKVRSEGGEHQQSRGGIAEAHPPHSHALLFIPSISAQCCVRIRLTEGCSILALAFRCCAAFAAVIIRIREPKTTALVFTSGKMVWHGHKSEEQSRTAARKVCLHVPCITCHLLKASSSPPFPYHTFRLLSVLEGIAHSWTCSHAVGPVLQYARMIQKLGYNVKFKVCGFHQGSILWSACSTAQLSYLLGVLILTGTEAEAGATRRAMVLYHSPFVSPSACTEGHEGVRGREPLSGSAPHNTLLSPSAAIPAQLLGDAIEASPSNRGLDSQMQPSPGLSDASGGLAAVVSDLAASPQLSFLLAQLVPRDCHVPSSCATALRMRLWRRPSPCLSVDVQDFKIQNIVGSCDVRFPIRLEGLQFAHSAFCSVSCPLVSKMHGALSHLQSYNDNIKQA